MLNVKLALSLLNLLNLLNILNLLGFRNLQGFSNKFNAHDELLIDFRIYKLVKYLKQLTFTRMQNSSVRVQTILLKKITTKSFMECSALTNGIALYLTFTVKITPVTRKFFCIPCISPNLSLAFQSQHGPASQEENCKKYTQFSRDFQLFSLRSQETEFLKLEECAQNIHLFCHEREKNPGQHTRRQDEITQFSRIKFFPLQCASAFCYSEEGAVRLRGWFVSCTRGCEEGANLAPANDHTLALELARARTSGRA